MAVSIAMSASVAGRCAGSSDGAVAPRLGGNRRDIGDAASSACTAKRPWQCYHSAGDVQAPLPVEPFRVKVFGPVTVMVNVPLAARFLARG